MKGWFDIPGVQTGDRTLEEQLTGLPINELALGNILDVGCAEGLISKRLLDEGAESADCLELNPQLRLMAARLLPKDRARVFPVDLNSAEQMVALDAQLRPEYEAVLLLSILHKLEDPARAVRWAAGKIADEGDIIAIRLPNGPQVVNKFTKQAMCDVRDVLAGWPLEERPGPRGEWVGIFRRA
jgi:2-polyprenyl-3-methyl-5-hydroxy-6-metoxy-1,4-benzoquinol methylase